MGTSLIRNGRFEERQGGAPVCWEPFAPREEIAASFAGEHGACVHCRSAEQIGFLRQTCAGVCGRQTYRCTVRFRAEGVASPGEAVWIKLEWLDSSGVAIAKDYVTGVNREGDRTEVEGRLPAPEAATAVTVELGLQHCEGTVRFEEATLEPCEPLPARMVRLATVGCFPPTPTTPDQNVAFYASRIDEAGRAGADIVCLGEAIGLIRTGLQLADVAESIPGPATETLGEAARRNNLWIVAGLTERDGRRLYNTAVLIDRQGRLAGRYRKTHLPEAEVLAGLTPGTEYPVFQTDFGVVGIQVCWDNFFPEVARSLALNGAEILFTPIWGDPREGGYAWDIVARARAIDNAVYYVAATYEPGRHGLIIDPGGHILADLAGDGGVAMADADLGRRRQQQWLSVSSTGDWKCMAVKERHPSTYGDLTRS